MQAGMDCLHGLGYKTVLLPHALDRGPLYYAGTVEQRVADLHAAFADAEIDGIVCTRGGWGSAELLPHLDAKLIRANPKVFVGYSDHTSLHVWLAREAGLKIGPSKTGISATAHRPCRACASSDGWCAG